MRFSLTAVFGLFVVLALAFLAVRWFGRAGLGAVVASTLSTSAILALGRSANRRPMAGVVIMLAGLLAGGLAAEVSAEGAFSAAVLAVGIMLAGSIWLWQLFTSWSGQRPPDPPEQISSY